MPNITQTTNAVFIPEVWSGDTIKATRSKLVLANLVKRHDKDVMKYGDTIHVPLVSQFTANDKLPNTKTSPQAHTETEVQIAIDKHKEVTFIIEDIAEIQSEQNLRSIYTDEAGYAIAKAVDSDLAALAAGFSTTYGTYNTAITTDVVLDSIEALDLADVPEDNRHFVYRPDVKRDLLDLATFTSSDFVNGRPVSTGAIGDLYGVMTYMSTNIVKTGNNTDNMLFHKDALALAMQKNIRSQSEYDQDYLADKFTTDCVYGVKEMRDDFGILVKT